MARTKEQVEIALKSSAQRSNAAIDTEKGPFYDLVIAPVAEVLPTTEEAADRLAKVYSADFAKVATQEEAQAFLDNWAEAAGSGAAAGTVVYFMRFARPEVTDVYIIPKGTLVANLDQTLQYVTTQDAEIRGDIADTFYNAQRRTYEVGIPVVAVSTGVGYELPAGRIQRLVQPVVGIDAVENRTRATGAVETEDVVTQIDRVKEKFKGLAINTANGGIHRIKRFSPANILDVRPITSSNRELFKRYTLNPVIDYYILGEILKQTTEVYVSTLGSETRIKLNNVPAKEVSSVLINNVPITGYYLETDTSIETGFSAISEDYLVLDAPLIAGDVVIINLTYNSLIADIQAAVLTETKLFTTDEVAREFRKVPLIIDIVGKALPSYDPTQVQQDTLAALESLLTPTEYTSYYLPLNVIQQLIESVAGLASPVFRKFKKSSKALAEVELISLSENEVISYDPNLVTVTIRSS